jgi:hypothetical protein
MNIIVNISGVSKAKFGFLKYIIYPKINIEKKICVEKKR